MKKVTEFETDLSEDYYYKRMLKHLKYYAKIAEQQPLSHKEIITYSLNMPSRARHQLLWKLNNDPKTPTEAKLENLQLSL